MPEPLLHDLSPKLAGVDDVKKFLIDPNNWVSTDILIGLYERVKKLFDNDNVVFEIGFESVAKRRLGYIQRIFVSAFRSYARAPSRHALTLKRLQSLNDKFNRNKRVELVDLRKDGAVVRLKWFKDMVQKTLAKLPYMEFNLHRISEVLDGDAVNVITDNFYDFHFN